MRTREAVQPIVERSSIRPDKGSNQQSSALKINALTITLSITVLANFNGETFHGQYEPAFQWYQPNLQRTKINGQFRVVLNLFSQMKKSTFKFCKSSRRVLYNRCLTFQSATNFTACYDRILTTRTYSKPLICAEAQLRLY